MYLSVNKQLLFLTKLFSSSYLLDIINIVFKAFLEAIKTRPILVLPSKGRGLPPAVHFHRLMMIMKTSSPKKT